MMKDIIAKKNEFYEGAFKLYDIKVVDGEKRKNQTIIDEAMLEAISADLNDPSKKDFDLFEKKFEEEEKEH